MTRHFPRGRPRRVADRSRYVLKNMERMGDQCVNICKLIPMTGHEPPADEEMVELILRMGRQTRAMISQAKQAFGNATPSGP